MLTPELQPARLWRSRASRALHVAVCLAGLTHAAGTSTGASEPTVGGIDATRVALARDGLALRGIDRARLDEFVDGAPIAHDEQELLWRLLSAASRFTPLDLYRARQPGDAWTAFLADPAERRGDVVYLAGHVERVDVETLPDDMAARFGFDKLYRCQLRPDESSDAAASAAIYALQVPKAWALGAEIDERASADAFFVKLASRPGDAPRLVFAAARIAWHPDSILGGLGMDVGRFDDVRQVDVQALRAKGPPRGAAANVAAETQLSAADRECFYELLAACGRAEPSELVRQAGDVARSVAPLFNEPQSQQSRLILLDAIAREILLVRVDDRDVVERFGIDHYYTIAAVTDDSQGNPIFFCVRELPDGLPTGSRLSVPVRLAGFFLKTWGYRPLSADLGDRASAERQLAPLLIGRAPLWTRHETPPSLFGAWLGLLFAAGIAAFVAIVAWSQRGDRRFRDRVLARRHAAAGPVAIDATGDARAKSPPSIDDAGSIDS